MELIWPWVDAVAQNAIDMTLQRQPAGVLQSNPSCEHLGSEYQGEEGGIIDLPTRCNVPAGTCNPTWVSACMLGKT